MTEIDSKDLEALREEIEKNFVLMRIPDCEYRGIGEVPGVFSTMRGEDDKIYLAVKIGDDWFHTTDELVKM